jgi:hypothetical protein
MIRIITINRIIEIMRETHTRMHMSYSREMNKIRIIMIRIITINRIIMIRITTINRIIEIIEKMRETHTRVPMSYSSKCHNENVLE